MALIIRLSTQSHQFFLIEMVAPITGTKQTDGSHNSLILGVRYWTERFVEELDWLPPRDTISIYFH
jgi:hypothetical protein